MYKDINFMNSISDDPIEFLTDDTLSMKKQIKGFSKYIKTCETPLTISIQGSWGSGKTSFFKMIRNAVENSSDSDPNNCFFLEFNAWQYSQFNKDSELPISLLTFITSQIDEKLKDDKNTSSNDTEKRDKLVDTLKTVVSILGSIGNRYAEKKFGFDFLSEKKKFEDDREELDRLMNGVNAISELQKDFREFVENALKKKFKEANDKVKQNSRLVIFIDDLDRLLPEKAVDLLDTIKIFLDCPRCVFVLAVDYDVVIKGVEKKYNHEISREKANDYFEKMIQVVYRLPEKMASMKKYIKSLLEKIGSNITATYDFAKLISAAEKDTPRNVKRLINNFYLIKLIDDQNFEEGGYNEYKYDVYLFSMMLLREVCYDMYMKLYSSIDNLMDLVAEMIDKPKKFIDNGDEINRKFMISFMQATDIFSHNSYYSKHPNDNHPSKNRLKDHTIIDRLKRAIKALNYSDEKIITVESVSFTSNQFKTDRDFCKTEVPVPINPYTKKGSVNDAYKVIVSLIASNCTNEGVNRLCQEIDFIEKKPLDKNYEEITYKKYHVPPLYESDSDSEIDQKSYEDKIYIRTCNNEDECLERIERLADILEITILLHNNMTDNKETIKIGNIDRKNDDKEFFEVKKLWQYFDFGFMNIEDVIDHISIAPLTKNFIISLQDLRKYRYKELLDIYNNDVQSVYELVETAKEYGIFIEKNKEKSK